MKDKTCLITGASSGIGKATALALARMERGHATLKTPAPSEENRVSIRLYPKKVGERNEF